MHFTRWVAEHPGNHLLIGANLKLLRGEIIPLIRSIARSYRTSSSHYRTDTGIFRVGQSQVIVAAGASQGDEDRLRTYHGVGAIMAEEVAGLRAMPETFYDMALTRQEQRNRAPVWASCNPSHPLSWAKIRLDEGRWPHSEMWLLEDNPTLSQAERDAFASQFTRRIPPPDD